MPTPTPQLVLTEKREEIIHQAFEVFYKEGFHASGVDSLLKGTGISKRTLYKYFDSKEDLIEATIVFYSNKMKAEIGAFIEKNCNGDLGPSKKIFLIFDWLENLLSSGHVLGCYAVNAKVEYASKHIGIEKACDVYFKDVQKMFEDLCKKNKNKEAKKVAHQIYLVFQGSILNGQISQNASSVQVAKEAAKLILTKSES